MTTIKEIEDAVRALADEEFAELASWFDEYEEHRWNRQLERDQEGGSLRDLMEKARCDFEADKCRRL